MESDRNTIAGFGLRVRKNLTFMLAAHARGEDVHIVTELTNALLGLIIFPYEHSRRLGDVEFRKYRLSDLAADGWPLWQFNFGSSPNLDDLVSHLRNALSHRRVHFSSDCRTLEGVNVTFSDRKRSSDADYWSTTIRAAALLEFVLRFSKLIDRPD